MDESAVPAFPRGVRLQHDRVRDQWIVQAPERAFLVDAIAAAILGRVDGATPLSAIIDGLAGAYEAPRDVIARDVHAMVADLVSRQALVLR